MTGSAAIHFRGPVSPERSSAMMSMAPRSAASSSTACAGLRDAEMHDGHIRSDRTDSLGGGRRGALPRS
jgi:hypothetical protein